METNRKAIVIIVTLLGFGAIYNQLVAWMDRRGYDRGMTSLQVVGGTLVTVLAFTPLFGWRVVSTILAGFAASGLPMIVGSLARYVAERDREERIDRGQADRWLGQ